MCTSISSALRCLVKKNLEEQRPRRLVLTIEDYTMVKSVIHARLGVSQAQANIKHMEETEIVLVCSTPGS